MKTVYIADDGKEFDSEFDCLDYEKELEIKNKNLKSRFWDSNGDCLSINNLDECIEKGHYLECYSDEEADFICDYAENKLGIFPFALPPHEGKYYFDDNELEWIEFEKLYEKCQKALQVFNQ